MEEDAIWHREKLTQVALEEILSKHEAFIAGKPSGRRALLTQKDLTGLNLSKRNLSDVDMTGSVLARTNCAGTIFNNCVLFGVNFARANLQCAKMQRADLRGASLRGADLTDVDLFDADLRDGMLAKTGLSGDLNIMPVDGSSDISATKMVRANLTSAKMGGSVALKTDFTGAVMRRCKLARADLRGAIFEGANLEGADLQGADLRGANLKNAVMTNVTMAMTETAGSDMSGTVSDKTVGRPLSELPASIVVALARHKDYVEGNADAGAPLDLSGFDVRQAGNLTGRCLTGLRAVGANLVGMNLEKAALQGANFEGADLRCVKLSGADLRGANLRGANLSCAELRNVNLGALMLGADRFLPARLDDAVARFADFRGAQVKRALFNKTDLSSANFTGCAADPECFALATLDQTTGV